MIEIHFGQGAAGGVGHYIENKEIDWKIRRKLGLGWGEKAVIHANFPGVHKPNYLKDLIRYLRDVLKAYLLGKIGGREVFGRRSGNSSRIRVDVITLDGSKAGSKEQHQFFKMISACQAYLL